MDELTALKAFKTGDKSAFGILITQYYKSIYRYVYQFTGSSQDADDICQETFLRAFEGINQLRDGECFKGWIFMIASNLSRRHIKNSRSRKKLAENTPAEATSMDSKSSQPFVNFYNREKATIIRQQLARMPEQMRLATILVHVEDFTQKDAAEILNCSESTISRQLESSMNLLRNSLKKLI